MRSDGISFVIASSLSSYLHRERIGDIFQRRRKRPPLTLTLSP